MGLEQFHQVLQQGGIAKESISGRVIEGEYGAAGVFTALAQINRNPQLQPLYDVIKDNPKTFRIAPEGSSYELWNTYGHKMRNEGAVLMKVSGDDMDKSALILQGDGSLGVVFKVHQYMTDAPDWPDFDNWNGYKWQPPYCYTTLFDAWGEVESGRAGSNIWKALISWKDGDAGRFYHGSSAGLVGQKLVRLLADVADVAVALEAGDDIKDWNCMRWPNSRPSSRDRSKVRGFVTDGSSYWPPSDSMI